MTALADRLAALADALPPGATVALTADAIRALLTVEAPNTPEQMPTTGPAAIAAQTGAEAAWRTKLWTVPDDVRLGVREVAEATGRSKAWVYRACSTDRAHERGRDALPCSRLDGSLVFRAGELRDWLRRSEATVNPAPKAPRRMKVSR